MPHGGGGGMAVVLCLCDLLCRSPESCEKRQTGEEKSI